MSLVGSSKAGQPWRTPWTSSAGTRTKAAETSASPNGIPSACIWPIMKVAAAMPGEATRESRRSCASPIVWIGKRRSMALSCVNANIDSGVDPGISSGHSAADTPAYDQGREFYSTLYDGFIGVAHFSRSMNNSFHRFPIRIRSKRSIYLGAFTMRPLCLIRSLRKKDAPV